MNQPLEFVCPECAIRVGLSAPEKRAKGKANLLQIMLSLLWLGTLLVEASALSGTWCTNEPHNQENTMVAMDEHHTVLALMYQGELQQARFSIDNSTLGPDWGLLALTLECSSASVSLFQANEHLSYTRSPNTLCVDLRFVGLRCLPACPDFSTDSYLCSGSTSLSTGMLALTSMCGFVRHLFYSSSVLGSLLGSLLVFIAVFVTTKKFCCNRSEVCVAHLMCIDQNNRNRCCQNHEKAQRRLCQPLSTFFALALRPCVIESSRT